MVLLSWCEQDDRVRSILIQDGLCSHIPPILTLHFGDSVVMQDVVSLLRLVTLDEEARGLCQTCNVSGLLVQVMACHPRNSLIQTDACAVLSNLAIDIKHKSVAVLDAAVLDSVTAALLGQVDLVSAHTDWQVVKSACFTIKNFLYQEENKRALASRDDLLEGLGAIIERGPRRCKDAVTVLEKLQIKRAETESLQGQILEALQMLWNKPVHDAMDEILLVWKEHSWSVTVLIASLHQLQDMWQQDKNYVGPAQVERILKATTTLTEHPEQRVKDEIERLRALLTAD